MIGARRLASVAGLTAPVYISDVDEGRVHYAIVVQSARGDAAGLVVADVRLEILLETLNATTGEALNALYTRSGRPIHTQGMTLRVAPSGRDALPADGLLAPEDGNLMALASIDLSTQNPTRWQLRLACPKRRHWRRSTPRCCCYSALERSLFWWCWWLHF